MNVCDVDKVIKLRENISYEGIEKKICRIESSFLNYLNGNGYIDIPEYVSEIIPKSVNSFLVKLSSRDFSIDDLKNMITYPLILICKDDDCLGAGYIIDKKQKEIDYGIINFSDLNIEEEINSFLGELYSGYSLNLKVLVK